MGQKHGFFIPDAEFCSDVEGLITFLGMKVGCGNVCISCNKRSKRFRTLDACQKHMRDLAHCRFSIDGDKIVEYLDFYDYRYAEILCYDVFLAHWCRKMETKTMMWLLMRGIHWFYLQVIYFGCSKS